MQDTSADRRRWMGVGRSPAGDTRTAAVTLQVFGATQEGGALPLYGQLMAAALVCAAPVVALYLIFQRYLMSGLTSGGVK